jgi:hypothetical protein
MQDPGKDPISADAETMAQLRKVRSKRLNMGRLKKISECPRPGRSRKMDMVVRIRLKVTVYWVWDSSIPSWDEMEGFPPTDGIRG